MRTALSGRHGDAHLRAQ